METKKDQKKDRKGLLIGWKKYSKQEILKRILRSKEKQVLVNKIKNG